MYALFVHLLDPYTLLLVSLVVAIACAWRASRPPSRPLRIAAVLLGFLVLLSMPAVGYLALGSLEWSYPPVTGEPAAADVIVVLAGGLIIDDDAGTQTRLSDSSLKRCLAARALYRRGPGCRMIVSGGKVDWSQPGPTLAEAMRDFLLEAGVRPDDLVLEDKSSTTYENVLNSKTLLEQASGDDRRIWLVTDASHMRRSAGCFRALGIDVVPAPCNHHATHPEWSIDSFLPEADAIAQIGQAAHEWLGWIWYRLRGRV